MTVSAPLTVRSEMPVERSARSAGIAAPLQKLFPCNLDGCQRPRGRCRVSL